MNVFGYDVEATLFESDKSIVFRTKPDERNRRNILKIHKGQHPDIDVKVKYEQEYAIAHALNHPGVLKASELLADGLDMAIVFENFRGRTLAAWIADEQLPLNIALEISIQLASILEYIHANKIIHKDIRPANILWNKRSNELKIIEFGRATALDFEQPVSQLTGELEDTVQFMSPEQTGRMNRVVDYRTDFYSFGVTLFFLFTGKLPFETDDPLEIIHFHLARKFPRPATTCPNIPLQLSKIILKLVEKSAEARYQTAYGVRSDLENCQNQLKMKNNISEFPLARYDTCDRLNISQKIYGRQHEVDQLIHAFERVRSGTTELVFVAGYSGVGKTALVNELHKPITSRRGIYVSGKYDQYQRNIPYYAFNRVFSQLVNQVLLLPEEKLDVYKQELLSDLGNNVGILTKLIPNLELLVGRKIHNTHLGPQETKNLFNQLTKRFIQIFATAEHPLAIFIDDFQWADLASLEMLNILLTDQSIQYLLIIGAYRDNEVNETHPLILTKKAAEKKSARISTINLRPLSSKNVTQMLMDSFHVAEKKANALSMSLMEKTLGNPFFITQFLKRLHEDDLIRYDQIKAGWMWDIERIRECDITDNVVDLMLSRLSKLPSGTRYLMMIASCIGERIYLDWLSVISDQTVAEVGKHIWPIVKMGLMLPVGGTGNYIQALNSLKDESLSVASAKIQVKFLHDRVQQAAYATIPDHEKEEIHLRIGRKLRGILEQEQLDEHIFTVISQFNIAARIMTDKDEKVALANLNLQAARKAKSTLAYHSAIELLSHGINLLGEQMWTEQYEMSFELFFERAEAQYLIAELARSEIEFNFLLDNAQRNIDKSRIYKVFVDIYTTKGEIEKAVKAAIAGCGLLGIDLFLHPTREQVLNVYEDIQTLIGEREIADLVNLPPMDDTAMEVALSILAAMMPPALFYDQNLLYLEHCYMVEISLRHGNAPPSASGYSYFGMILGCMLDKFEEGYAFGKLGYDLLQNEEFAAYRAKVCLSFGSNVNFWVNHVLSDLKYLEEGFKAAIETGDITYSCYHCNHIVMVNLASGMDLDHVYEDAESRKRYVATTGYSEIVDIIESKQRLIQLLRGKTFAPDTYSDMSFSEEGFEKHLETNMSITVCWYYIHKTQAKYLFGYHDEAVRAAQKAEELIWSSVAHVEVPEHYLYYSLSLAATYESASERKQKEIRSILKKHLSYFKAWMKSCPDNFEHKYLLIEAEIARLENKPLIALQGYEKCIAASHQTGFLQIEALANELASRLSLQCSLPAGGRQYLTEALKCYRQWKAIGKLKHLGKEFSNKFSMPSSIQSEQQVRSVRPNSYFTATERKTDFVDYKTIVSMSRAIATQMDMRVLLTEIMKYTLENTGAAKASIAIVDDQGVRIEVSANEETIQSGTIFVPEKKRVSKYASESIVRYVARTDKTLILDNASHKGAFIGDAYVRDNICKSILCMPFSYKKGQNRILFLENNHIVDAFPKHRIETLRLILPQVAISIENAKLFTELHQAHEQLRSIFENSVDAIGVAKSGVHTLVNSAYLKMFGCERPQELIGKPLLEIISPSHRDQFMAYLAARIEGSTVDLNHETKGMSNDGIELDLEVNVSQYGPQGDERTLMILRDVTERRQLENQVRQSQKMEAIGTLAGGIAHDFNNILSGIIGYTEIARVDTPSTSKVSKYLDEVFKASLRAKDLVHQILAFSRQGNANRIPVQPDSVSREVIKMLRSSLPSTINISENIDPQIGCILADPIQIHQILMNLGTNAFHAMESSGGHLNIALKGISLTQEMLPPESFIKEGNFIELSVEDTGPGIAPEIQDKIFDPYFTTKAQGKGTGMGLAIVHGTVKSYGGFVSLRSEMGKGTTFSVFLPVVDRVQIQESKEENGLPPTGTECILFVDDEELLVELGKEMLEGLGYIVVPQTSAKEALKIFSHDPKQFDLVITDQTMPGMTGAELAQKMMAVKADIPIILCTGYSSIISKNEAKSMGIKAFSQKPYEMKALAKMIRQVLDDGKVSP